MCGIWGIMSRNNSSLFKTDLKPVKTLMTLTSLRGGHGCGMLGINKLPTDKIPISWVKAASDFHEFLRYPETIQFFKDFETPYAISDMIDMPLVVLSLLKTHIHLKKEISLYFIMGRYGQD